MQCENYDIKALGEGGRVMPDMPHCRVSKVWSITSFCYHLNFEDC